MELQELMEKRATLWEAMKQFLDEHTAEDGTLSAEDAQTYEQMEIELEELTKNIERYENNARLGEKLKAPTAKAIKNYPGADYFSFNGKSSNRRASASYRQAALDAIRTKFRVIRNDLAASPDTSGGYLIPAEWDTRLINTLEEENVMRQLGTSITTSGEHKINVVATKPAAVWVAEGGAMNFGNGTFKQETLDAHKVQIGILVTEELLADNAFDLENYIIDEFSRGIANAEEDAFINGDGNGKPTGFLTTIAADATAYITTTGANISADDIINLVYSLPRPYRKKAAFLANDATLALIRKFKDANQAYLWQPSYQAGEPDLLHGFPLYTTPYMPTAASGAFPIAFGNFSYYNIADRGTRSFQELRELYAGNGLVGFLMKERVDGLLLLTEAVRALKVK